MVAVSSAGGISAVSFIVDAPLADVSSRTIPAACSSSVMALLVTCCTECEEEGRRPAEASWSLSDATEFAVEFFRARAESGRSDVPAMALLMAKLAARGDE